MPKALGYIIMGGIVIPVWDTLVSIVRKASAERLHLYERVGGYDPLG